MLARIVLTLLLVSGCGARSGLPGDERDTGGAGGAPGSGGSPGSGGAPGQGGAGGEEPPEPCGGVMSEVCGTDVGECSVGVRTCQSDGFFGPCEGDVEPAVESCNGLDDDCEGAIDNGFGIGSACDGPDNDLCFDDQLTCAGCTLGPDLLETCNGVDDNCNGIVDSDCDVGNCSPTLLVTGSQPSDPNCIDFPVEAGSMGVINYPCGGGTVTATLGTITFSGTVTPSGQVSLSGTIQVTGPDGCQWRNDHFITGSIPGGTVQYFYQETLLTMPTGNCWSPCTETGTVVIDWMN